MDMTIVDKGGVWLKGIAPLGLRDPFSQVAFPFNHPVKVKVSDWIVLQQNAGIIVPCDDPLAPDPVSIVAPVAVAKATK